MRLSPISFMICVCVFRFEPPSDSCSSVSDHPVVLVAVFLHKFPLPPHQRGFFCNDNSIKLAYKSSTVSNTALTAVGVAVPVVSVSPAAVRREEGGGGAGRERRGSSSGWLATPLKTRLF